MSAAPPWPAVDEVRGQFSVNRPAYCRFVAQDMGLPSVWEGLRGQMRLGDEQFRSKMQHRVWVKRGADVSHAHREPARPSPDELLTEVAKAFGLARGAVLDCNHAQTYRSAVYLLRQVVNEPIGKVARRARIFAPRVSQIQAEVESAKPQGSLQMLLRRYKIKR